MKFAFASALAVSLLATGCMGGVGQDSQAADTGQLYSEAVLYNGQHCDFVFHGTKSPNTDLYAIWNLGVDAVLDDPYPTDARPNMYAVFAPSPADIVHHVDGFDQFDHYHVIDTGPTDPGYDGTWDVFLIFPGPNFDPATYQYQTSYAGVQAQQAAGILGPTLKTTDAGFGPLVLNAPVACRDGDTP